MEKASLQLEHLPIPLLVSYDGQGFYIEGLYINRPTAVEVAMFGFVNNATIKNVRFKVPDITGDTRVGAIAGQVQGDNTSATNFNSNHVRGGKVTGNTTVGGVIGRLAQNMIVEYLSYTGSVTGNLMTEVDRSLEVERRKKQED